MASSAAAGRWLSTVIVMRPDRARIRQCTVQVTSPRAPRRLAPVTGELLGARPAAHIHALQLRPSRAPGTSSRRLVSDYDPVRDGLTPPRNSGVAEAAVDKIKMIKRQMCSRAASCGASASSWPPERARYHHEIRQIHIHAPLTSRIMHITKCAGPVRVSLGERLV